MPPPLSSESMETTNKKVCDYCNREESEDTGEVMLKCGGDETAEICEECYENENWH